MPRRMAELRLEGSASDANGHSSLRFFPFGASSFAAREARVLCRQARPLDDPCVAPSDESRPGSAPTTVVLPLWYRLLRPTRPDRPQPGTMGTRGTLTDASTHEAGRLGAERSLVQIQSPRLSRSPLPKRAFGISGSRRRAGERRRGISFGTKRVPRSGGREDAASNPTAPPSHRNSASEGRVRDGATSVDGPAYRSTVRRCVRFSV
jgi:hypothetical protein